MTIQIPSRLIADDIAGMTLGYDMVKKLRSAYTGKWVKIRRSSDNTTKDIGFLGNYPDIAAALAFVGGSNGLLDTVYNQGTEGSSGDLIQPNTSRQATLISAGVLKTINGAAALYFNGANGYQTRSNIDVSVNFSLVAGIQESNATNSFLVEQGPNLNSNNGFFIYGQGNHPISTRFASGPIVFPTNVFNWVGTNPISVAMTSATAGNLSYYRNNSVVFGSVAQSASGATNTLPLNVGARNNGASLFFTGFMKNLMVFGATTLTTAQLDVTTRHAR